ncbi:MAG TPA: pilus assembly protein TadG-related protein [Afifellaceae bacterium]|nr:pilus assembly protein TadG-related protein [Afifellaceae bacterium]
MTTTRTIASGAASRTSTMLSRLRGFARDEGGAAVVLAALMFPVVIGGMGLGAETGYWYMTQRKLQHAADTAAHAAAVRKMQGASETNINGAADAVARKTGYSGGDPVTAAAPTSGDYVGNEDAVEVVLSEERPRLFSAVVAGLYSHEPQTTVTLGARAVAAIEKTEASGVACVLALSGSAPGAVTVSGSTNVNLAGCDVASNSSASDSFLMSGSARLSTDCVSTVGGALPTSGLTTQCSPLRQYAPEIPDPYGSVAEPQVAGACERDNFHPTNPTTVTPAHAHPSGIPSRRYCGGLSLKGPVTFKPGLYIIDGGDFTVNAGDNSLINGTGVVFYLTNGARLRLGGNATLNVKARTEEPFAGILFFGSRTGTAVTHQINGSSASRIQGAVYTPASDLSYSGNSGTSDSCIQVIGRKVTMTGNSDLGSKCEGTGTRSINTNLSVALVE